MEENFKKTVYETLADIFGIMFFIPIEPLDGPPPGKMRDSVLSVMQARLEVNGDKKHTVFFCFPEALARNIAINFMGLDEAALDEARVLDAVKEAANMVVGSLLGRIDPEANFRLGIPEGEHIKEFFPGGVLDNPGACVFETEYGYLWIDFDEIGQSQALTGSGGD